MKPLSDLETQALSDALDDEYHSCATYDQVIADFGEQRPFINIRDAEARHIRALCGLHERYQVPIPPNPWIGKVERFESLQAACQASVAAEIANAELYERLIATVSERADITEVFLRLSEASQERHLPAFQRCAQRNEGAGRGAGFGHRRRRRAGCHGGPSD